MGMADAPTDCVATPPNTRAAKTAPFEKLNMTISSERLNDYKLDLTG
jgi:hypothetical protein